MNIALLGFGKMGRMISSLATAQHKIVSIIDPSAPEATHKSVSAQALSGADVVIDFSSPSAVLSNVGLVAQNKKNIVMGTTGWYEKISAVKQIVESNGIGFLYASNFSIGVQLFMKLVERGGELFNSFPEYDAFVHEYHHNQKADSPSGTALSLGKILLQTFTRKKDLLTETAREKIPPDALHITSTRGGSVPGTHEVYFDSEADTIELKHTARTRAGFASGALRAGQWIFGKRGFFTMEDFLKDILK